MNDYSVPDDELYRDKHGDVKRKKLSRKQWKKLAKGYLRQMMVAQGSLRRLEQTRLTIDMLLDDGSSSPVIEVGFKELGVRARIINGPLFECVCSNGRIYRVMISEPPTISPQYMSGYTHQVRPTVRMMDDEGNEIDG